MHANKAFDSVTLARRGNDRGPLPGAGFANAPRRAPRSTALRSARPPRRCTLERRLIFQAP